jgi:hypothetical protein
VLPLGRGTLLSVLLIIEKLRQNSSPIVQVAKLPKTNINNTCKSIVVRRVSVATMKIVALKIIEIEFMKVAVI